VEGGLLSVTDGQNANQTTFNNAFMSRTANDNTTGKKDLQNADAASGANVINLQREVNSLNAFSGRTSGTAHDATPTWTNNDVGTSGDDLKERAEALTATFDFVTGHNHDGSAGSGGPLTEAASGLSGIVSDGNQSFSGQKHFEDGLVSDDVSTFNDLLAIENALSFSVENSTVTGSNANAGPYVNVIVRLTDASLVSIQNIDPANTKVLVLRNITGNNIELINNSGGTAANRIITGTGINLLIQNNAQVFIVYDLTSARWVVVGGSGSGGSSGWTTYSNENISGSGSVTSSTTVGQQVRRVTGNGAAVTASSTPFGVVGGWSDGLVVRLIGQSDTNTVTITHNDAANGAILNGDCTLGQYDVIELQWDSTASRWIEIARSIK
jgi:hypothetical protein